MMVLGMNAFGDTKNDCFHTSVISDKFNRIELKNMELDEIYVSKDTSVSNLLKQEWDANTVLLGKFENSLECGNISNNNISIEFILIKKRKKSDLTWKDVVKLYFNDENSRCEYIDYLVEANEAYEYALVPMTSGVMGDFIVSDIICEFEGTFIFDKKNSYQLLCNLEYGEIQNNIPSTVSTTFSKYPIVIYSGETEYKSGQINGLLLSFESIDSSDINYVIEKKYKDSFFKFLNNKKTKILKDGAGRYYMVAILDPVESPVNNLNQAISNVSFTWVECGDANNLNDLYDNGFIEIW